MFYGRAMLIGGNSQKWSGILFISSNLISYPLAINAKAGEHRRSEPCEPWRHNLYSLWLVRWKTIDLFSTTSLESQESYLLACLSITRGFFRLHNTFAGSIVLPPHQLRVFARLARWQSLLYNLWIVQTPKQAISRIPQASPRACPFIFTCKLNSFWYGWLCTTLRSDREAYGISDETIHRCLISWFT